MVRPFLGLQRNMEAELRFLLITSDSSMCIQNVVQAALVIRGRYVPGKVREY